MLLPILLALAPAVPQTTWHVDANAAGPGLGTTADPYSRIDYAVEQVSTVTGDTVLIEPGTYAAEDIEILGKALRLEANGAPGSVVITGPGGFVQAGSGSSALIRVEGPTTGVTELIGLSFVSGIGEDDGALVRGGVAFFQSSTVVIEDCSLEGKAHIGGAIFASDTDLTAVNSTLRGDGSPPHALGGGSMVIGGAIHAFGGRVELTDCDVTGRSESIYPDGYVYGESTSFQSCSSVTITRGSIRPGSNTFSDYYSTGGRIYARNTVLRVDQTVLTNGGFNSSRGTGIGAVSSDVHVTGVTFDMGQSYRIQGDGMHLRDCSTIVDGCTFTHCGGYTEGDGQGTDFFYFGGAVYSSGSDPCAVLNSSFTDNQGSRGGAVYAENGVVENCVFDGNTAFGSYHVRGQGGAVWLDAGSIQRCSFTNNIASGDWGSSAHGSGFGSVGSGGAVFANSGTIDGCRFEGNQLNNQVADYAFQTAPQAKLHGGALYAAGPVAIRNSQFDANAIVPRTIASGHGGPALNMQGCGVYLADGGTIDNCSFTGNGVGPGDFFTGTRWFGGGLYVEAGAVSISSSTFEGNEAEHGGAIYNEGGDVEVSRSILRANRIEDLPESTLAAERPAIAGAATVIRCTIVGHVSAPTSPPDDTLLDTGEIDSSILFGNGGLSVSGTLPVTYSIVEGGHTGLGNLDANPLFIENFADVRLWPASPAIDAGNPLLLDEGTLSRADMGALPRQATDCGALCADPLGTVQCTSNPNSTGLTGETQAFGSDIAADEFLLLSATQLPLAVAGYFVTSDTQGFVSNFGGSDGNLCLGMPLYRLSDQVLTTGTTGRVGRAVDTQGLPQGQVVTAGSTWTFQLWHRDPRSTTGTSNTTSAVSVTFL